MLRFESILANELLVLPSRNHNETGKDYAVACAVPCNAEGVTFLASGQRIRLVVPPFKRFLALQPNVLLRFSYWKR